MADVVPIARGAARRRRTAPDRRRELVVSSMANALTWLEAGLAGDVPLEQAVVTASLALWPAEREVLKAALA